MGEHEANGSSSASTGMGGPSRRTRAAVAHQAQAEVRVTDYATAPTCAGCACFRADVLNVATDEGSKPLCWLCRHAVVEHAVKLRLVATGVAPECATYRDDDGELRLRWTEDKVCLCRRGAIYPADVIARRDEIRAAVDARVEAELASRWPAALREAAAAARAREAA